MLISASRATYTVAGVHEPEQFVGLTAISASSLVAVCTNCGSHTRLGMCMSRHFHVTVAAATAYDSSGLAPSCRITNRNRRVGSIIGSQGWQHIESEDHRSARSCLPAYDTSLSMPMTCNAPSHSTRRYLAGYSVLGVPRTF